MTISSEFTVNGTVPTDAVAVAAGSTVLLALVSLSGANGIEWSVVGNDHPDRTNPSVAASGSPQGATASFVMPADTGDGLGQSYRIQCVVRDGARSPSTSTTVRVVGIVNAVDLVPFAVGEDFDRDAIYGWTPTLNRVLSATGSPGTAGVGLVGAADAVATSNVSQSGTASIDGVTLTANVSRVLCVGQTSTTQNGIKLVQAGAWTNPTDFSTDAQVAASLGAPIYVKPGGSTGGNTNWQLTVGSTIAGAKTYQQLRASNGLARVRAVQTKFMYGGVGPWVYDNAAGTWTADANGALPSPWTFFDDITTPAVGDRVLVQNAGFTATDARSYGIYELTSVGSAGTKASMRRPADLNTSASFVGGVSFDVFGGTRYINTRWQLSTLGTVTLGTTLLAFNLISTSVVEVDLSASPYFIKDYPDYATWYAKDRTDYGRALDLFCYTYRNTGGNVVGRLPSANGGYIAITEPFDHYGYVTIKGAGKGASLLGSVLSGGHICVAQNLYNDLAHDGFPEIGGTLVDTYANSTPLSTYRNTNGDVDRKFYYNLSHAGLILADWTQFECRMLARFETVNFNDPYSHIISCRGARTAADTTDYGPSSSFEGCPFSLVLNEKAIPPTISARMRLTDTTAGVYATGGGITHTGGGAGTVVGDGVVKPTEDAPNFTVRIESSFTAGAAGVNLISWSIDGTRFCAPVDIGTATTKVIGNEVNEFDQPFTAKIVLSGALVATDTYKIPCSGVNQLVTLTSATTVTTGANFDICLQYRSNKMFLYVSTAGGALDSGASAVTGVACTGVVRQRYWENTILGHPQNAGVFEASSDFNGARFWLGGIRFKASSVTAPGATVTTLYDSGNAITGGKLCWVPNTVDVRKDPGAVYRRRYKASAEPNQYASWIVPRMPTNGLQISNGGFEGLSFSTLSGDPVHGCGLLTVGWRSRTIKDVRFEGGYKGWSAVGPDYCSITHDIDWGSKLGASLEFFQGQLTLTGVQNCLNSSSAEYFVISSAAVSASGCQFQNTENGGAGLRTRVCMRLSQLLTSSFDNWQCDAENQQQSPTGRELIRACVNDGCTLTVSGNVFTTETLGVITNSGGVASGTTGEIILGNLGIVATGVTVSNVPVGAHPPFSVVNSDGAAFVPSDGLRYNGLAAFPTPMVDRADKWRKLGVAGVVALTSGSQSLTFRRGIVSRLALNTLAANTTYTLSVTGAVEGDIWDFRIEPQATYTTTLLNGGAAAATGIYANGATPAATRDRYRMRFDSSRNWISI